MVAVIVVLNLLSFWQINSESGTFSMAPALPPCNGQVLAEGFTYRFRDPRRGEIVMFRARGSIGGEIVPTNHHANLQVNKRVIGVPGDTVEARSGRVYVNGSRADNIPTRSFEAVHLGHNQYFVMGDNRDNSQDSRYWGFLPRDYIKGKAVVIYWSYDAGLGDYHEESTGEALKGLGSVFVHFFTRTRWDRMLHQIR